MGYRLGHIAHPEGGSRLGDLAHRPLIELGLPAEIVSGESFSFEPDGLGTVQFVSIAGVDVSGTVSSDGGVVTVTAPLLWDHGLVPGMAVVMVGDGEDMVTTSGQLVPPSDIAYHAVSAGLPVDEGRFSLLKASELDGVGPVENGWHWVLRDPNDLLVEGSVQADGTADFADPGSVYIRVAVPDGNDGYDWTPELEVVVAEDESQEPDPDPVPELADILQTGGRAVLGLQVGSKTVLGLQVDGVEIWSAAD